VKGNILRTAALPLSSSFLALTGEVGIRGCLLLLKYKYSRSLPTSLLDLPLRALLAGKVCLANVNAACCDILVGAIP
jgi:hypothetical protein